MFSNADLLWEAVQKSFYSVPNDYIDKLVKSVPRRLKAVRKAKGFMTKYNVYPRIVLKLIADGTNFVFAK